MTPYLSRRAGRPGALTTLRRHIARRERLFVFDIDSAAIDALELRPVPGIEVRPVTPPDARRLAHFLPPRETLRRLGHGDLGTLAEDAQGRAVGCAWIAARAMPAPEHIIAVHPGPGEAYGYGLIVDPGMRRRGVGRAMLAAGRTRIRARGIDRVVTHVEFANDASLALQRSTGSRARRWMCAIVFLDRFSLILRSREPRPG